MEVVLDAARGCSNRCCRSHSLSSGYSLLCGAGTSDWRHPCSGCPCRETFHRYCRVRMHRATHRLSRDSKRHRRNVQSSPFHAGFELLRASTMRKVLNDAGRSRSRSETSRSHLFGSTFLGEECPRQRQIARPSNLDITFRAANNRNRKPQPFDQTGFVRAVILVFCCALERLLQDVRTEYLWSLGQDQMLSHQCRFNEFSFCLLDGVHNRNAENGSAALRGLTHDVLNIFDRDERPHAVVHRHNVCSGLKLLQSHCDGVLPALSTFNDSYRLFESS